MAKKNQMNHEGGTSTSQIRTGYFYGNSNTTKKPSFKSKNADLEDAVFARVLPSDAAKYEYYINNLIKYSQREYSAGIYLEQAIEKEKFGFWHSRSNPQMTTLNQKLSLIWRRLSGNRMWEDMKHIKSK